MKKTMLAAGALIAVMVAHDAGAALATNEIDRTPPCKYDEAGPEFPRCVWDARHMGNGLGQSFINRPRIGDVLYISHRRAHRLMTTNN